MYKALNQEFPALVLKDTYPIPIEMISVLRSADYLDKMCLVNQKLEDTISAEGGDKVSKLLTD